MAIHSPILLGLGIAAFLLGIVLWRWSSRHSINLKGAAISSAYSAVKGGNIPAVPDALKVQYDKVAAETSNVGRARVVGGSVARHFIAKVVGWAGLAAFLSGGVMIALSFLWK